MAKIEVKNNSFWMFEARENDKVEEQHIYDNNRDAVDQLKEYLKEKGYSTKDLSVFEVDTSEENWHIKEMSWAEIVEELV